MGGVAWTEEEDYLLKKCIQQYGEGKWHRIPFLAGLNRCRKSCRLRWLNYLRPNIRRGNFTQEEIDLIIKLHESLGNRWSLIAGRLPGRTANDVKNYWNCHLSKKLNAQENNKDKLVMTKTTSVSEPPRTEDLCFQPPPTLTLEERILTIPKFQFFEDAETGQVDMKEQSNKNEIPGNGGDGKIDGLSMDFQFEKDDESIINKWNWDDLVFDMDIWIESL